MAGTVMDRELSAGVVSAARLRTGASRVRIGGDVVFVGDEAGGLSEAQAAEVERRVAMVKAAKVARKRASETGSELLESADLDALFGPDDGSAFAWPRQPRVTTPDDVRQVRRLRREGLTNRQISQRVGLCPSMVSMIYNGKVWGDIPDEP